LRAQALVPPCEWRFPVVVEYKGGSAVGDILFVIERIEPASPAARLKEAGSPAPFERFGRHAEETLAFEVFCHKSEPGLRYPTPLEGHRIAEYLRLRGAEHAAYLSREMERDVETASVQAVLPGGQTVNLAIKPEKAYLKGIGATVIAEAEVPRMPIEDDAIRLGEFLAGL